MTKQKEPHSRRRKLPAVILCALLALMLIFCAAIVFLWHHELATALSIKKLNTANPSHQDGNVYRMTVSGDYYFDDFLEQGGASDDSSLIRFITGHITKGLIPMTISESNIGCSSFTASAADGDRLFARNYDFSKTNTCIVYTNPGGGRHASISTIDLQFIGIDEESDADGLMDRIRMLAAPYVPLDGVNDAGVACSIHMSYQGKETVPTDQQTSRPDLTSTTMLRLILDYADSVEEAVELVSAYDLHDSANTSFHYMVADATGHSAILEWVNGTDSTDNDGSARTLCIIDSEDASYQVMTNYILAEGYYDAEPAESMAGLDRYEYLSSALSEKNAALEEQQAMELLAEVGRRTWDPEKDGITVHSVVYNLTDRTATWTGNEHYGEEGYTFHLTLNP